MGQTQLFGLHLRDFQMMHPSRPHSAVMSLCLGKSWGLWCLTCSLIPRHLNYDTAFRPGFSPVTQVTQVVNSPLIMTASLPFGGLLLPANEGQNPQSGFQNGFSCTWLRAFFPSVPLLLVSSPPTQPPLQSPVFCWHVVMGHPLRQMWFLLHLSEKAFVQGSESDSTPLFTFNPAHSIFSI